MTHPCVTWLIPIWNGLSSSGTNANRNCTALHATNDSFICNMTHSCSTWLIRMRHDAFICDTSCSAAAHTPQATSMTPHWMLHVTFMLHIGVTSSKPSHNYTVSLAYTHTNTHFLPHKHTLSLPFKHTHSLLHKHTVLDHTHKHTHSLSHTHRHTYSVIHTHMSWAGNIFQIKGMFSSREYLLENGIFSLSSWRCGWVFLERTQILNWIQFTRHFTQFVVEETKRFVGSNVNVILTRQTCGQRSSMSAGSKRRALENYFYEQICHMFLVSKRRGDWHLGMCTSWVLA